MCVYKDMFIDFNTGVKEVEIGNGASLYWIKIR